MKAIIVALFAVIGLSQPPPEDFLTLSGYNTSGYNTALSMSKQSGTVAQDSKYSTSQRIQISEPCPLVAKWLTQSLSSGTHFQMPRYEPDLGILTFKIIDKNLENHAASVALGYFAYNFIKIHRTLRTSPAMAAGVTDRL